MAQRQQIFIVTEQPPWYRTPDRADRAVFSCESTNELFHTVAKLMLCKHDRLTETDRGHKPTTVYKTVRDMVIGDADTIQQKPSRSLLLALMDLVDIEGGNELTSMESVDRAGVKHVVLGCSNYTMFSIPSEALKGAKGKRVIPVVTQYKEKHNLVYCDNSRSMMGTYTVHIPSPTQAEGMLYFMQEVLFVPGSKSLDVLKEVTGDKFEFWDMALEVPTDTKALTPSFQRVQSFQLLIDDKSNVSGGGGAEALVSHMEDIHPMCCVLDDVSVDMLQKKREASVDCFTDTQVRCDLGHFQYAKKGSTRTVYFRRSGRMTDGKRLNLLPVVALRKGQEHAAELYISTTARFCRAVKHSCIKGNGQLVGYCKDTLKELNRETFITGPEMYQEIYLPALTAFFRRVNPHSWRLYLPMHIQSIIKDPGMVDLVNLAIRFMTSKIPNAFAVAELLYCPIEKVQEYQKIWDMYMADIGVRRAVHKKRVSVLEEQMRNAWARLTKVVSDYCRKTAELGSDMASARGIFEKESPDVAKVQKQWAATVKKETNRIRAKGESAAERRTTIQTKADAPAEAAVAQMDPKSKRELSKLAQMVNKTKVLFLHLRTYHSKLKRFKAGGRGRGEGDCDDDSQSPSSSPRSNHDAQGGRTPPPKRHAAAEERKAAEELEATGDETDGALYSIVTPDAVPISTWIGNMSTLLLSEPWLKEDNDLRREAVCTLLGLDNTLLNRKNSAILRDWVSENRAVVNILQAQGLHDRLSNALVYWLEALSTDNWKEKVLLSFRGAGKEQKVSGKSKAPRGAQRARARRGTEAGARARKITQRRPAVRKQVRSPSTSSAASSSAVSESETETEARDYPRRRHRLWSSEAQEAHGEDDEESQEDEEEEVSGEHLEATMDEDANEPVDDYDYNDSFIDDNEEEEEEDEDDRMLYKRKAKAKSRRKYRRVAPPSDSEDDIPTKSARTAMSKEEPRGCKRAVSSGSEDETLEPVVKRVKHTPRKENRGPSRSKGGRAKLSGGNAKRRDRQNESAATSKRKATKRRETAQTERNTRTTECDSLLGESEQWDSETYKGKEKKGGVTKKRRASPSKSYTQHTDTDSEDEGGENRGPPQRSPDTYKGKEKQGGVTQKTRAGPSKACIQPLTPTASDSEDESGENRDPRQRSPDTYKGKEKHGGVTQKTRAGPSKSYTQHRDTDSEDEGGENRGPWQRSPEKYAHHTDSDSEDEGGENRRPLQRARPPVKYAERTDSDSEEVDESENRSPQRRAEFRQKTPSPPSRRSPEQQDKRRSSDRDTASHQSPVPQAQDQKRTSGDTVTLTGDRPPPLVFDRVSSEEVEWDREENRPRGEDRASSGHLAAEPVLSRECVEEEEEAIEDSDIEPSGLCDQSERGGETATDCENEEFFVDT